MVLNLAYSNAQTSVSYFKICLHVRWPRLLCGPPP